MARIGILTCTNATQDPGCSSVSCLADPRKRKGAFADYPAEEKRTLVLILSEETPLHRGGTHYDKDR
jgi:hypothetical protein